MALKQFDTRHDSFIMARIRLTLAILWAHKPILAMAWLFSGVWFHLVCWWRPLYGPPAHRLSVSKTVIARWMEHIRSQGSGTMPVLSGTLTCGASWGSGCPPRLQTWPWCKRLACWRHRNKLERVENTVVKNRHWMFLVMIKLIFSQVFWNFSFGKHSD